MGSAGGELLHTAHARRSLRPLGATAWLGFRRGGGGVPGNRILPVVPRPRLYPLALASERACAAHASAGKDGEPDETVLEHARWLYRFLVAAWTSAIGVTARGVSPWDPGLPHSHGGPSS